MVKKCNAKVLEFLMSYVWDGRVIITENVNGHSIVKFEGSASDAQDYCVDNWDVAVRKVMFCAPCFDECGVIALHIKLI